MRERSMNDPLWNQAVLLYEPPMYSSSLSAVDCVSSRMITHPETGALLRIPPSYSHRTQN
jgi:hypothetical protein